MTLPYISTYSHICLQEKKKEYCLGPYKHTQEQIPQTSLSLFYFSSYKQCLLPLYSIDIKAVYPKKTGLR